MYPKYRRAGESWYFGLKYLDNMGLTWSMARRWARVGDVDVDLLRIGSGRSVVSASVVVRMSQEAVYWPSKLIPLVGLQVYQGRLQHALDQGLVCSIRRNDGFDQYTPRITPSESTKSTARDKNAKLQVWRWLQPARSFRNDYPIRKKGRAEEIESGCRCDGLSSFVHVRVENLFAFLVTRLHCISLSEAVNYVLGFDWFVV